MTGIPSQRQRTGSSRCTCEWEQLVGNRPHRALVDPFCPFTARGLHADPSEEEITAAVERATAPT